jgi:hypothetical protein
MALSSKELSNIYNLHNLNKRSLKNAIDLIKLNLKDCFRKTSEYGTYTIKLPFTSNQRIILIENIRSYNRILFGLLVSWADESIRRLFYEPKVFSENQINYLLEKKALEQKWSLALKIAFLKAYDLIPIGNETCQNININCNTFKTLSPNIISKYDEIKSLLEDFLIPAFNIRNKVQHGEWIAAFKPPNSKEYSRHLTVKIFNENIVTISSRLIIFNAVYQMIIDLARFSSKNFKINPATTPFEYFYLKNIKKIEQEKRKISKSNLNVYIDDLILKKENGKEYRRYVP